MLAIPKLTQTPISLVNVRSHKTFVSGRYVQAFGSGPGSDGLRANQWSLYQQYLSNSIKMQIQRLINRFKERAIDNKRAM